jgi:hypothetical protein
MKAGDPAAALEGMSVVITGVGSGVVDGATVKGEDREAKEGIVELDTVIVAVPEKAVSVGKMAAVSSVALT